MFNESTTSIENKTLLLQQEIRKKYANELRYIPYNEIINKYFEHYEVLLAKENHNEQIIKEFTDMLDYFIKYEHELIISMLFADNKLKYPQCFTLILQKYKSHVSNQFIVNIIFMLFACDNITVELIKNILREYGITNKEFNYVNPDWFIGISDINKMNFLYNIYFSFRTFIYFNYHKIMCVLAYQGNLEALKWISAKLNLRRKDIRYKDNLILYNAMQNNRLEVIIWLMEVFRLTNYDLITHSNYIYYKSAAEKKTDILTYISVHYKISFDSIEALLCGAFDYMKKSGDINPLVFFINKLKIEPYRKNKDLGDINNINITLQEYGKAIDWLCAMRKTPIINDQIQKTLSVSLSKNYTFCVKFLLHCIDFDQEIIDKAYTDAFFIAAKECNLERMIFCYLSANKRCVSRKRKSIIKSAIKNNKLDILIWLYNNDFITFADIKENKYKILCKAFYRDRFIITQWMIKTFDITELHFKDPNNNIFYGLVRHNKLFTLTRLEHLFHSNEHNNFSLVELAAENGYLELMIWLLNRLLNNQRKCAICVFKKSFIHGHLHITQWLYDNYQFTYQEMDTVDAMAYFACLGKNLGLLRWLHSAFTINKNIILRNIYDIIGIIVSSGSLDILQWLVKTCDINQKDINREGINQKDINREGINQKDIIKILYASIELGYIHIVQWLIYEFNIDVVTIRYNYDELLHLAYNQEHDNIGQWIKNIFGIARIKRLPIRK